MSYWSDAIIDCETTTPEQARELAATIVDWLIDARIIENRQCDGCRGDGPCYAPGIDYLRACTNVEPGYGNSEYATFSEPGLNGMRVITAREFLYHSSGNFFCPVSCPECRMDVPVKSFHEAGAAWLEGGSETFQCPHCDKASNLPAWSQPPGGFAMLAFEFFNWPEFSPQFLAEFSRRLGHRLAYFGGQN